MAVATIKTCTVEGCGRKHESHGLCHLHHQLKIGTWSATEAGKGCSREGCDRGLYAKGMCRRHYTREARGLEPEPAPSVTAARVRAAHGLLSASGGRPPRASEIVRVTQISHDTVLGHLRCMDLPYYSPIRPKGKRYSPDGWPICQHCETPIDPAEKRWMKFEHNACHRTRARNWWRAKAAAKRAAKAASSVPVSASKEGAR